jgi:hypothetical protein
MKGIIPLFLMQIIKGLSYSKILLALMVNPTVDRVPFISILSFIEIGIPKRGGR